LLRSCLAPEVLELKLGAHVMCIKNSTEKKYVNGSLGIIEGFEEDTNYPVIRLNNNRLITVKPDTWELIDGDKHRASATQLPLRLAWAITVHKSQGMTLDSAQIDLSRAFVEGMGYVALSRVKNMQSLKLDGLNRMALQVSPLAKKIDAELREKSQLALQENDRYIAKWIEKNKNMKEPAPTASKPAISWSDKLAKMRQEYPKAYMPWGEEDDRKLVLEFSNGKKIGELSKVLGRHKGSIRSRLVKHFGEDIFDTAE
jgi:ATP-dependent DNA helicase PIF1